MFCTLRGIELFNFFQAHLVDSDPGGGGFSCVGQKCLEKIGVSFGQKKGDGPEDGICGMKKQHFAKGTDRAGNEQPMGVQEVDL